MNERVVIAPVRKLVRVKTPITHAFETFTTGLTRWWPYDHGVGKKPVKSVKMEPKFGGRWLEISEDGTETTVATIIQSWLENRLGERKSSEVEATFWAKLRMNILTTRRVADHR